MTIDAYPLQWPAGWPRTQDPEYSNFQTGLAKASRQLIRELELMGATDIVISSNAVQTAAGTLAARQPKIEDTGVAAYFVVDGEQKCIPCDRWVFLEDNVHAIELTVNALRGIQRWGAAEMMHAAFAGFAALPAGGEGSGPAWWDVLGVRPDATIDEISAAYRALVKRHHPDAGGNAIVFQGIVEAVKQAREARGS